MHMNRRSLQRRRTGHRGQRGFSLIEVMIAVAITAIMMVVVTQSLSGVMRWYGKATTIHALTQLQDDLTQAYSENMTVAEESSGAVLSLDNGDISPTSITAARRCTSSASTFSAASTYLDMSLGKAYLDGFNVPLCVLITPQESFVANGVTLYYHTVAIVSTGSSGVLNASTALSDDGTLTLGGDNMGVVINGRTIAEHQFTLTRTRMENVVQALQSYFQGRFQASTSPSTAIDYFGTSSGSSTWDTDGALPVTSGGAMNTSSTYYQTLGLAAQDVTDPYGQSFYLDNASSSVRSPSNSDSSMNSAPPWSARIYTTLPGNVSYVQSAVGTY